MTKRRLVSQITDYLTPEEIYTLITGKKWDYAWFKEYYWIRDRSFMSMSYLSGGRVSAVTRLLTQNFVLEEKYILVHRMVAVKRTEKVIKKYGEAAKIRDDFILPLEHGLFDNPHWDRLIPFSELVRDHLVVLQKGEYEGRVFPFGRVRGWQIINNATEMFPNWFRAQAEHFYANFLIKDTIKVAKFLKIVDPKHVAHYIGYDWREQLK